MQNICTYITNNQEYISKSYEDLFFWNKQTNLKFYWTIFLSKHFYEKRCKQCFAQITKIIEDTMFWPYQYQYFPKTLHNSNLLRRPQLFGKQANIKPLLHLWQSKEVENLKNKKINKIFVEKFDMVAPYNKMFPFDIWYKKLTHFLWSSQNTIMIKRFDLKSVESYLVGSHLKMFNKSRQKCFFSWI